MSGFDMVWGAWNDCNMVKVKMANLIVIIKRYLKIPFSLNFLCGNAVPMRSRPTTPLHFYIKMVIFCIQNAIKNIHQIKFVTSIQIFLCELNTPQQAISYYNYFSSKKIPEIPAFFESLALFFEKCK